jgi:hypothetical protein
MPSVYASQVEGYGRRWHRPWLVFLIAVGSLRAGHWLAHGLQEEPEALCGQRPGSKFCAGVEIDGLMWTADLQAGLACARGRDRRLLVAFHGMMDTTGRANEITIFREQAVQAALGRYVLVKLYVDYVPSDYYREAPTREDQRKDAEANLAFQKRHFHTVQAPLYVVLQRTRDGRVALVGSYGEGLISDAGRFGRFLHDPRARPREDSWATFVTKLRQLAGVP